MHRIAREIRPIVNGQEQRQSSPMECVNANIEASILTLFIVVLIQQINAWGKDGGQDKQHQAEIGQIGGIQAGKEIH